MREERLDALTSPVASRLLQVPQGRHPVVWQRIARPGGPRGNVADDNSGEGGDVPPIAFCIGLSRTGTRSFGKAAESLGFSRLGWIDRSDELMRAWHDGRHDELFAVANAFEIIHDIPWALIYEELAEAFPDARFALTRRSSVDVWLRSIIAHTNQLPEYWGHEAAYGATMPADHPDVYRDFYARHLDRVREFFRGSDRMVELCWETGSSWEHMCAMLEVPVPEGVAFPHWGALATKQAATTPRT
jgi:hypothetical protein